MLRLVTPAFSTQEGPATGPARRAQAESKEAHYETIMVSDLSQHSLNINHTIPNISKSSWKR